MRRGRAPKPIDIDAAAEDYQRGMTLSEITERYGDGLSRTAIYRRLLAYGVEMRRAGRRQGTHHRFCHDTACDMYARGHRMRDIAKRFCVSVSSVWRATHHINVDPDARRAVELARLR